MCDYSWDLADATVVCRQLGYLRAVGAPRSATFGAGSGPSWYSYVGCAGTEMKLTECSKHGHLGSACSHSRDAGVVCSSESILRVQCTSSECSGNAYPIVKVLISLQDT